MHRKKSTPNKGPCGTVQQGTECQLSTKEKGRSGPNSDHLVHAERQLSTREKGKGRNADHLVHAEGQPMNREKRRGPNRPSTVLCNMFVFFFLTNFYDNA